MCPLSGLTRNVRIAKNSWNIAFQLYIVHHFPKEYKDSREKGQRSLCAQILATPLLRAASATAAATAGPTRLSNALGMM